MNEKSSGENITAKKFPINSDKFSAKLGSIILSNNKDAKVDLHKPDIEITVEIRENSKTYIFDKKIQTVGP